jgi:hypothetical protein
MKLIGVLAGHGERVGELDFFNKNMPLDAIQGKSLLSGKSLEVKCTTRVG